MNDQDIKKLIAQNVRYIKNFKKDVNFCDICPMLKNYICMNTLNEWLFNKLKGIEFDYIAGLESRGFLFGPQIAYKCGKGFVPIRKKGKLPGNKVELTYNLEYGTDTIELQADAIEKGSKVIILDDLIATGGTAVAATDLIHKVEGTVVGYIFIVELKELNGKQKFDPSIPIIIAASFNENGE